jgi:hypothetical protein
VGCGIAIDDFGAGFTAYKGLQELPFTMIKLDGAFCRDLGNANGNTIYVKSMVELAHSLGIAVVAKQVEQEVDASALHALGVDLIQGNLVGQPSIAEPWEHEAGEETLHWNGADHDSEVAAQVEPEVSPAPEVPKITSNGSLLDGKTTAPGSSQGQAAGEADEFEDQLAQLHQVLRDLRDAIGNTANEPVQSDGVSLAS